MIDADLFVQSCTERGFRLWSGVPCSFLTPLINFVISSPDLRYVGAANEGDAVAIAAGAQLGGLLPVVMMQNSGLGNAVNPLTSLAKPFGIPMLLIITLRGDPEAAPDEPQHQLMGQITAPMLDLMQIRWEPFPTLPPQIGPVLDKAAHHMASHSAPYALIMKRGSVNAWPAPAPQQVRPPQCLTSPLPAPVATRGDILAAVQSVAGRRDLVIASTGFTGRELYALDDRDNQLYMAGSMGCAASIGLGLALARPERRVIVLDGDGALLMRLGCLATIGHERPQNLVHVVLDNRMHESTGGQPTVSPSVDFAAIAGACGYPRTLRATTPDEVASKLLADERGPVFLHVPIRAGYPSGLPRPRISPRDVAARLRAAANSGPPD